VGGRARVARGRRVAAIAAIAALSAAPAAARADRPGSGGAGAPDPRRKVAVLEYRGGSAELRGVGAEIAALLARRTALAVIDGERARAARPEVAQELSACAGEADCVARVGRALGAAEVLLVGVAEFGDVILTLQRVDVAGGAVVARLAEALPPGAAPAEGALEGYLERVMPASDFRRFGVLRIAADVAGASVALGGRPRGVTPLEPLRVPAPARYDIRVAKDGHVDFRATVAVPPDAEVLVRAELPPRADRPWYGRWWVLAIGGAVVAGAVTAAVLLSRDGDGEVPVRVNPF